MMTETSEEGIIEFEANFSDKEETQIRTRLIQLQQKIKDANVPVILLLCGVNGSGKNATLGTLRDWLNERLLDLHAYERHNIRKDPVEFRRYWCDTPANGMTGLFVSSWYSDPLVEHSYGKLTDNQLYERLDECNTFEKSLADNGAVFCKIWFHKDKAELESFLRALDEDPYERWRVMPDDWKNCCLTDNFESATRKIIRYTDKDYAPWFEVKEGNLTERLRQALNVFCEHVENQIDVLLKKKSKAPEYKKIKTGKAKFLKDLDLNASISKEEYRVYLPYLKAKLNALMTEAKKRGKKLILGFEGPDASGKGGVISRLASSAYIRDCNIFPIAAPTKEELAHHFLWRFWNRLRDQDLLTIFDRTWYGRVLVERIEHFATDEEWERGYNEINDYEKQLTKGNNIVVKFLLYISSEEQLARFKAREEVSYKTWKIGEEDWRNREKWDQYETAYDDMLEKTNTKYAPWIVVPDNNKKYGRIMTMKLLCDHLEKVLDYVPDLPMPQIETDEQKEKKKKKKDKE